MSKNLLMGAILAVAALAVMPAVAQAVPHYYKNNVLIPEGERVPILEWGKLTREPQPEGFGGPSCENLGGGFVENPVAGGAGIGATLRFTTYNCTDAECPAGEIEIGGKKYEKEFDFLYPPQDFPWPSLLTEEVEGTIRTESKGIVFQAACMAHGFTRAEAGEGGAGNTTGIGSNEQFALPEGGNNSTTTCVTTETDKETPQNQNGTSAANPSKVVFNAGSGELSCDGGLFTSKTKESLKLQGYKAQELITVR